MAEEQLILVDENNRATGTAGKTAVHRAGLLHRAFSIFIVDERGRMLLQQRSPKKYHSGGLWANSCCGHPRPGERTVDRGAPAARRGARRRRSDLSFGFFARYRTELDHGMHENEFVYVYFGRLKSEPQPDPDEVADVEFLSFDGDPPAPEARAGRIHGLVPALFQSTITPTSRALPKLASEGG